MMEEYSVDNQNEIADLLRKSSIWTIPDTDHYKNKQIDNDILNVLELLKGFIPNTMRNLFDELLTLTNQKKD